MVVVEKISFNGWPNCLKISNSIIELIATTDVGPRIISFGFTGGENQFTVFPSDAGITGGDQWHNFGGHRLWHAPEDLKRTYAPDNNPVQVKQLKDGVRLTAITEPNGTQKIVEIHMADNEAKVKVVHTIINHTLWTIPLSVWALSVMNTGGKAIVPHPPFIAHDDRLTPTHSLVLWGYTKMNDPRWTWGERYFFLRQDTNSKDAQKIGALNTEGWAAYLRKGVLFVDKFKFDPDAVYPDMNSNFETYSDPGFLEIETLGPLVNLEPGENAEHIEEWYLHKNVKDVNSDADVEKFIVPLLK